MNDLIEYYKELIKFRQINEGISKEEVGNRINTLNKIIFNTRVMLKIELHL